MGDAFSGVDKMIQETFLPCPLFGKTKTLSPIVGALTTIHDKKAGLGLLNTVMSLYEKCLSSQRGSAELVLAAAGGGGLSNADHLHTLRKNEMTENKIGTLRTNPKSMV